MHQSVGHVSKAVGTLVNIMTVDNEDSNENNYVNNNAAGASYDDARSNIDISNRDRQ